MKKFIYKSMYKSFKDIIEEAKIYAYGENYIGSEMYILDIKTGCVHTVAPGTATIKIGAKGNEICYRICVWNLFIDVTIDTWNKSVLTWNSGVIPMYSLYLDKADALRKSHDILMHRIEETAKEIDRIYNERNQGADSRR